MTATTVENPRRIKRRWRRLRLGVWLLVIVWLAHFAYIRITTPTAAVSRQTRQTTALVEEQADELTELIRSLPPVPAPTSLPRGFYPPWTDSALAAGLLYEWEPDPNSPQANAIKYINTPTTGKALDRIVALCAKRQKASDEDHASTQTPQSPPPVSVSEVEYIEAIFALAFRARYRVAEKHNPAGALDDLRAALRLHIRLQMCDQMRTWWLDQAGLLVQREFGCLIQEVDLPPPLAREMVTFLKDELPFSVTDAMIRAARVEQQIDLLLDRYYTDDGHGDGWLVLSATTDRSPWAYGPRPTSRGRFWNVFSPLFSSRKDIRAKLTRVREDFRQLGTMDYDETQRFLTTQQQSPRASSVLDGPLMQLTQGIDIYSFDGVFSCVMRRHALVVMLALSAYRHEHDTYPDTLDALSPAYLTEIPLDIVTRQPFSYERVSDVEYKLGPGGNESLPDDLYQQSWMSRLGYQSDSYLPRRISKQP